MTTQPTQPTQPDEFKEPDWIAIASEQLNRLENPHREKKRLTIIELVKARLEGRNEETVWRLPHTCSRNTYHSTWKHDPTFAEVLEYVSRSARTYNDQLSMRQLAKAAERLAVASPVAVSKVIEQLQATDPNIILRAAIAILDRSGLEEVVKRRDTDDDESDWWEMYDEINDGD